MPNIHLLENLDNYQVSDVVTINRSQIKLGFEPNLAQILKIGSWGDDYGFGVNFLVKLIDKSNEHFKFEVVSVEASKRAPEIILLVSVPRPQILKRLLESLAYYPVKELILFPSEKSEKSYLSSRYLRSQEIEDRLKIGSMQAGYSFRSKVSIEKNIYEALSKNAVKESSLKLLAEPNCSNLISDLLSAKTVPKNRNIISCISIGPEAGWSLSELDLFKSNGFQSITLSDSVLRVDTAALVVLSQFYLYREYFLDSK